jgi:hypothetical protein
MRRGSRTAILCEMLELFMANDEYSSNMMEDVGGQHCWPCLNRHMMN